MSVMLAPGPQEDRDVPSGLPGIARLPWGTHLCHFYRTADDLASTLVPFFAAGLANHERCLWITSSPFHAAEARRALAAHVPDLFDLERRGQIEILEFADWYLRAERMTTAQVIEAWLEREAAALRDGYAGLRLTGNTSWLRREDWRDFEAYERRVHAAFGRRRVVAVCSYSLERCSNEDVLDVVRHHGLSLVRRDGRWVAIRGASETLHAVGAPADLGHDAILYRDGQFPAGRVARFLAEGLGSGAACVAVITRDREPALRAALAVEGIDVDRERSGGRLVWWEAEEVLPTLLREGRIGAARFEAVVPPVVEALRARFGAVRVYGEMVDVLASGGRFEDALALERLWEELLRRNPAPVLCTYDAEAFDGPGAGSRRGELAALHGHVEDAPHAAAMRDLVAALAERTREVADEAARRTEAERERDRWRDTSRGALDHVRRLQRVTAALLAARTAGELADVVTSVMADAAGASSVVLARVKPGAGLAPLAWGGAASPRVAGTPFSTERGGPLDQVAAGDRPVLLGSPDALRACWPGFAQVGVAAFAAFPLESGGARQGVLALGFDGPRPFAPADLALLDDLARQAAMSLERAKLLEDLELARVEAERANGAKDEFLAMLGHELRNPLAPMLTVLHVMERRAPEEFRREREILGRQLRHMQHLVDDLLDVSRIVRGAPNLSLERVEFGAIVAEAVETAAPLFEARRQALRVIVPEAGLALGADRHRLVRAVLNLLTNAARYTPVGGNVTVTAEAREGRIALRVTDDGQGIEPELLPRLFDPFVQGPQGLARSEGGLGLGLAIARSIIDAHGGTIAAHSAGRGRGSEFTVTLPGSAARGGAAPLRATRPRADPGGPSRRVLVVDDNVDAAETLSDVLRDAGHVVQAVRGAGEALSAVAEFRPDVAVLDIGLPGVDGWTLGAQLRTLHPPLECVAVTGYGMEADRARSRGAGFVGHLVKPVDLDALALLLAGPPASAHGP